jgi:hypothetical protein
MMIRAGIAGLTLVIGASFAAYLVRPIPDQAISLPSFIASPDPITPEPTPEPIIPNPTLHGIATHYDAERKGETTWYSRAGIKFYGAAGPDLRAEVPHRWRNKYRVLVTSERTGRSLIVWIADFCECRGGDKNPKNDRLVDLAPAVWNALGVPLHLGVTPVTIELLP